MLAFEDITDEPTEVPSAAEPAARASVGRPQRPRRPADPADARCGVDDLPALLSVPRAAVILGLSRASAYRYAAAGDLPVQRLGGRVYVVTARIRHLLDGKEDSA
jgi:hypothetical protein